MGEPKILAIMEGWPQSKGFISTVSMEWGPCKMSGHYYNRGVAIKRDSTVIIHRSIVAMSIAFTADSRLLL